MLGMEIAFWSLDQLVVETLGVASVCACVRTQRFFSETIHYFSLKLLVRACRCEKNFPSAFLKKFPFCQFWPKTVQNWPFWPKNGGFRIFLRIPSLLFSETLQLIRAFNSEKNVSISFLKKIPVLPILAKNCPKLAILAQNAQKWRFFAFFSESLHYFFLKLCS